jgi:hypothetical protein
MLRCLAIDDEPLALELLKIISARFHTWNWKANAATLWKHSNFYRTMWLISFFSTYKCQD